MTSSRNQVVGRRMGFIVASLTIAFAMACTKQDASADAPAGDAGIDSVNARLAKSYREKDPASYATLFTDSAAFEWPASPTVRGRAGLQAMATELWPPLPELDLKLSVATRRNAPTHVTEFGAFEESWRDSTGGRTTEYGRYAAVFARQKDGGWLIDRWFGFSDSTHTTAAAK